MIKPYPILELTKEYKIFELLPGSSADDRLEASGVCFRNGYFYIIFDNSPHIARLDPSLMPSHPANTLLRQRGETTGFEDITFHQGLQRYLVIIESLVFDAQTYKPNIEQYDLDFRYLENAWVNFPLKNANKGIEGLAYIQHSGQDYVLGLCESNKSHSGQKGKIPGGGRIQILQKGANQWDHKGTIKLPKSVAFEDYACMDIANNRIAIVSQVTSALWIGEFRQESWEWASDGQIYLFPKNEAGELIYCNIEGVSWITSSQLVFVSDKRKPGKQPKTCSKKDQSVHIFNIPSTGR